MVTKPGSEKPKEAEKAIISTGKRKRAIARAHFRHGTGKLRVNSKPIETSFGIIESMKIREPLMLAGGDFSGYDIEIVARGGGPMGQANAIRLAIAKGIAGINPELKKRFLEYDRNMLVADERRTEPRKPPRSSKGARRYKQRSKR